MNNSVSYVHKVMDVRNTFDVLSDITEHYEAHGAAVRNVEAVSGEASGGVLRASLELVVSLCSATAEESGVTATDARFTAEGGFQVELDPSDLLSLPSTDDVTIESGESLSVTEDGMLIVDIDLAIRPPDGETEVNLVDEQPAPHHRTTRGAIDRAGAVREDRPDEDPLARVRDESVPPYEDTPYLERLYETCETFEEMSREIEMDVSAETVRRYMIEAEIHEPESYETRQRSRGDDGEKVDTTDPSPATADDPLETIPDEQLITDGIGLPAEVTITDIADAVVGSRSAHEVTQKLDLTEEQTRELLRQLNLLDLVLHRVGAESRTTPTYHTVAKRIRQCTPETVEPAGSI